MSYLQFSIKSQPDNQQSQETVIAWFSSLGFEGFIELKDRIEAFVDKQYFKWEGFREMIELLQSSGIEISYQVVETDDQNWNKEWEKNFEPVFINDRVLIRAPFHSADHDLPYTIVIEPKMSFGTGHHQTTRLMMQAMTDMDLSGLKVLDMGCGTGILGMYASKKGAAYVLGVDIDNWAYENAIENISRNRITNMDVMLGDASSVQDEEFDLILANINRNVLVRDLPIYAMNLKKGGVMLLSGILTEDVQYVLDSAYVNKLLHTATREESGWLRLSFIKE